MESVVHQPVGDVAAVDIVLFLEVREVENHLVGYAARFARVVGAEFVAQGRGHVVGIDDRHFGRTAQPRLAQQLDVT